MNQPGETTMTTFKPGDRVRIQGWASAMTVELPEPDTAGLIICRHPDGTYERINAATTTLIPPKVYADVFVQGKNLGCTVVDAGSALTRDCIARISWDGETLAVEP